MKLGRTTCVPSHVHIGLWVCPRPWKSGAGLCDQRSAKQHAVGRLFMPAECWKGATMQRQQCTVSHEAHRSTLFCVRHARLLLRQEDFCLPAPVSDAMPALWTLVKSHLRPVCACPWELHVVKLPVIAGDDKSKGDDGRVDVTQLSTLEADWLRLVAVAVSTISRVVGVTSYDTPDWAGETVLTGTGSDHNLAPRLGAIFDYLGSPLVPVWRATSTAPLWVCKMHAQELQ